MHDNQNNIVFCSLLNLQQQNKIIDKKYTGFLEKSTAFNWIISKKPCIIKRVIF